MTTIVVLIALVYIIYLVARVTEHYNPHPGGSQTMSNQQDPLQGQICGQMFGKEILLPGGEPGTGIRKCCLLFKGHDEGHSTENPDLLLPDYEEGDLG